MTFRPGSRPGPQRSPPSSQTRSAPARHRRLLDGEVRALSAAHPGVFSSGADMTRVVQARYRLRPPTRGAHTPATPSTSEAGLGRRSVTSRARAARRCLDVGGLPCAVLRRPLPHERPPAVQALVDSFAQHLAKLVQNE